MNFKFFIIFIWFKLHLTTNIQIIKNFKILIERLRISNFHNLKFAVCGHIAGNGRVMLAHVPVQRTRQWDGYWGSRDWPLWRQTPIRFGPLRSSGDLDNNWAAGIWSANGRQPIGHRSVIYCSLQRVFPSTKSFVSHIFWFIIFFSIEWNVF